VRQELVSPWFESAGALRGFVRGGDVLKVPFETLNVLKGTFETSGMP
jgi:hypothetical protein